MTTTPSSTVTTIPIRRAGKTTLGMSYDFTDSDTLTRMLTNKLLSSIGPAIGQWWDSLTPSQRSVLVERGLNLKTWVSFQP